MNFKDLIEEFYAYCNEKSTTPTREVLEDLRQIWDCYSSENGDRCIWEACKDFAKTPAPETVQARRYDLSNSIVRITRDMWRIGHNNPMRKYPNPIIPGFEAEELVDYAKALTKNDLSTDEFLMVSMLLSGLKWTEMVAMEWSRVIIDHVSTPAFVIGDRYLTLTSRINPDDFCLILAMAKTKNHGRVLEQGTGGLRSSYNQAIRFVGKTWAVPSALRNRWIADEIAAGNDYEIIAQKAGMKITSFKVLINNMITEGKIFMPLPYEWPILIESKESVKRHSLCRQ